MNNQKRKSIKKKSKTKRKKTITKKTVGGNNEGKNAEGKNNEVQIEPETTNQKNELSIKLTNYSNQGNEYEKYTHTRYDNMDKIEVNKQLKKYGKQNPVKRKLARIAQGIPPEKREQFGNNLKTGGKSIIAIGLVGAIVGGILAITH